MHKWCDLDDDIDNEVEFESYGDKTYDESDKMKLPVN